MERVRVELEKLLQSDFPGVGLCLLEKTGLGDVIWKRLFSETPKEWAKRPGPFSENFDPAPTVVPHLLQITQPPRDRNVFPALSWWILLLDLVITGFAHSEEHATHLPPKLAQDSGSIATDLSGILASDNMSLESGVQQLGRALRFSRDELLLLKQAHRAYPVLADLKQKPLADQLRLVRNPGLPLAIQLFSLLLQDDARKHIDLLQSLKHDFKDRLTQPMLLSGADLLTAGAEPGPRIGELLDLLESEQLEGRLHTRESAEEWLAQILASR